MMTDYWAHHYFDNPKAAEEVEDEDFNMEEEMARLEREAAEQEGEIVIPDDFEEVTV